MKKILCPVDGSAPSKSGMEYAGRLAKAMAASLTLLYVRTSIWPEAVQLKEEAEESDQTVTTLLAFFASEVHREFGIPCNYHIEQTTNTFEEAVAAQASRFDLIVMGTNGADDYYQYTFGSHAYHVVKKSHCPVLIVPDGFNFELPRRLLYAYDPDTNPIFLIDQLKSLAAALGMEINVVHIAKERPTPEADRKMQILQEAVRARSSGNIAWSFDFQYSTEVALTLHQCMKTSKSDLLALSYHHRSLLDTLFRENVVKQISMTAEYPLFVFWH